ncbi:MAG: hypothetical protein GF417_13590 [Candidatus Latescibacteria bacterium]|nr:hypothetical protein [bacterium]MBD3425462.1 hypothetical protein [Candidatus Latescibacterota bacterium]
MSDDLRFLLALQDLDIMIREVKDKSTSRELENMGFELTGLDELMEARENLISKISTEMVKRYEKLSKVYQMAILPITGEICLGCFGKLPTKFFSTETRKDIITCENCGRILYII